MRTLLLSLLVLLALANSDLNLKFKGIISGQQPLTNVIARDMYYNHFTSNYPKSIYRFKVFERNLKQYIAHNLKNSGWEQGINDFSDMTWQEFKGAYLMAPQNCSATNNFLSTAKPAALNYPTSFEWNSYGVVTPVKNQGSCGSCWAFSTVGTLEAHWRILGKGSDVFFSEQQLVDCARAFENYGCEGGLPSQAFEYIKHAGGIQGGDTYPYTARDGVCVFNVSKAVGRIRYGSYNITAGSEDQLADRLYNVGPVSIAYQVIEGFSAYKAGVYVPPPGKCGTGPDNVNHAVVATGYGYENGVPFWNVKNSWGTSWGNNGYFKILRGNNTCAIAQCNSYPLIDQPAFVKEN